MNTILDLNSTQLREIVGGEAPFDPTVITDQAQSGRIPDGAQNQDSPGAIGALGQDLHDFVKGV